MKNLFVYPMRSPDDMKNGPYLAHLVNGLRRHYNIVNDGIPLRSPWELFRHLKSADAFIFNWVENKNLRFSFCLHTFVAAAKIFGKKICWVHHNRHPHAGETRGSRSIMNLMNRSADVLVVHTKESYPLLGLKRSDKRVIEFFHPFFETPDETRHERKAEYDLLIWGNMRASKGVREFIEYWNHEKHLHEHRVMIAGRFASDGSYREYMALNDSPNTTIVNRFLSKEDLDALHGKSRFVLFLYTGNSVLNSGALVTSLPKLTPIIGPHTGAFKELAELGLIHSYKTFSEVADLLDDATGRLMIDKEKIVEFIKTHDWEAFIEQLSEKI